MWAGSSCHVGRVVLLSVLWVDISCSWVKMEEWGLIWNTRQLTGHALCLLTSLH